MLKRTLPLPLAVLCGSMTLFSCNPHGTSEKVRAEIKGIDWQVDSVVKLQGKTGKSSGGTGAKSSEWSVALKYEAPEGHKLPADAVARLMVKITGALRRAGAEVLEAEELPGVFFMGHDETSDESTHLLKVTYRAGRTPGTITGTLVKRRYHEIGHKGEIVGQLLVAMHEQR